MSGIVLEGKYHIGRDEFKSRVDALVAKAAETGLEGIVILGSSSSPENLIYVSNYCLIGSDMAPYGGGFGSCGWYGAFVVGVRGDAPTLILDRDYWEDIARKVSWIEDIRSGDNLWEVVGRVMRGEGYHRKIRPRFGRVCGQPLPRV